MGLSKDQQVACLYNLKSQIDGMVAAVKGGVLNLEQALQVVHTSMGEIYDRMKKADETA